MDEVRIDEGLWEDLMVPEGVLTQWIAPDGALVKQGAHVADVMIEGALHEIMAPTTGRLRHEVATMYVIEPGTVIGRIAPAG